ncbi:MAG TPA: arylamine N-acetyltransferase [Blastocatellia bacterium]|nr:arylamine N-acetyltransferase [Blastocatellia bacterium]
MNVKAYLERINYDGPLEIAAETLRRLHRAHMLAVPFENLDIHLGRPIALEDGSLFSKIIERRRGGFCYELNGTFASLLSALGFRVEMLSAGVAREDGGFGPPFDHMALLVHLGERWLADVGFGDSFGEPLLLDDRGEQMRDGVAYRIDDDGESLTLSRRGGGEVWEAQYRFTLRPYVYTDYVDRCRYHETSPESHFTRRRVCTRATDGGRITLSEMRLIVTRAGHKEERLLESDDEYAAALREHFGIDLGGLRFGSDLSLEES